jgi:hypothetical protein
MGLTVGSAVSVGTVGMPLDLVKMSLGEYMDKDTSLENTPRGRSGYLDLSDMIWHL